MTEFERFAEALAKTESGDRELAWGDSKDPEAWTRVELGGAVLRERGANFMAMGRWQMHPAWFMEWFDPALKATDSWDEVFRAALGKFWTAMTTQKKAPNHAAMWFHLGASAYASGDWDHDYGARFVRFWNELSV